MPRVVLVGLDGFPLRHVRPEITPTLWRLAGGDDDATLTGTCALPATTYPSFASLLTGAPPSVHGVWVTGDRPNAPAWGAVQRVAVRTLLDRAGTAGLRAVAVMGDHHLAAVLRIPPSVLSWPPDGEPPAGTQLDAHGYATNAEVRPHLLAAAADPNVDLLFAHLNEADTVGHDFGPDAHVTRDVAVATDRLLAELATAMAPVWEDSVLIIVSDHDMERRVDRPLIKLVPGPLDGLAHGLVADGGAAVIRPLPGRAEALVRALREVEGVRSVEVQPKGFMVAGADPVHRGRRVTGGGATSHRQRPDAAWDCLGTDVGGDPGPVLTGASVLGTGLRAALSPGVRLLLARAAVRHAAAGAHA